MGAYRFHLISRSEVLRDEEGRWIMNANGIARAAVTEALEILAHEVRSGHVDLDQRIDVEDASGAIVLSVHFADVLTISDPEQERWDRLRAPLQ